MAKTNVYDEYMKVLNAITAKKDELQNLEVALGALKEELIKKMPLDTERNGLVHTVTIRHNVSYKDVVSTMKEYLVPKARQDEVADIITEYTTESEIHNIKVVRK